MLITMLEVTWYPSHWENWQSIDYPNPDWDTIQFWIECLDRDEIPFIWLHIGEHIPGDEPEHTLDIMGGRGEYNLHISDRGQYLGYLDNSRSNKVIQIWESDQGYSQVEKHLCNDIELVFIIARYFAETGKAFPGVNWRDE